MNTAHPYIWNYIPLAFQLLVAIGMACGMVGAFLFHREKAAEPGEGRGL